MYIDVLYKIIYIYIICKYVLETVGRSSSTVKATWREIWTPTTGFAQRWLSSRVRWCYRWLIGNLPRCLSWARL